MKKAEFALIVNGSPRGHRSNSASLGNYLMESLGKFDIVTEMISLYNSLETQKGREDFLIAIDSSDIVVFTSPLYAASPPAVIIRALELIHSARRSGNFRDEQRFVAMLNCGFPEAHQNDTACAIYQKFAVSSGFIWAGCLSMGMGEAIAGRSLEEAGAITENVRKAIELAAASLYEGANIPEEAMDLMAMPLVPEWMYSSLGEMIFRREAEKRGQ